MFDIFFYLNNSWKFADKIDKFATKWDTFTLFYFSIQTRVHLSMSGWLLQHVFPQNIKQIQNQSLTWFFPLYFKRHGWKIFILEWKDRLKAEPTEILDKTFANFFFNLLFYFKFFAIACSDGFFAKWNTNERQTFLLQTQTNRTAEV